MRKIFITALTAAIGLGAPAMATSTVNPCVTQLQAEITMLQAQVSALQSGNLVVSDTDAVENIPSGG